MGTFIVSAIVIAALVLAVISLRKDKKAGKSLCGGKCSECPGGCHRKVESEQASS
jgi:hypothetical protein